MPTMRTLRRDRRYGEQFGDDDLPNGRESWLGWRSANRELVFPPLVRGFEARMQEVGKSNAGHQRVSMHPCPGTPLEIVETEFLVQRLMCLRADPACLDARIHQHAAERQAAGDQPVDLGEGNFWLAAWRTGRRRNTGPQTALAVVVNSASRNSRNPTGTGTSPRANVRDTRL